VVVLAADEYARLLADAAGRRESFADHLLAFPGGPVDRMQARPRDVTF
jgi:hypothetical protein